MQTMIKNLKNIIYFTFLISIILLIEKEGFDITLCCGIWGLINTKKSKFDKTLFNVLGIHNDSRGGDSCGIFIDGKTEYGIDKTKLYANFYKTSKVIRETDDCKIAIGHCRKASVGVISEATAQPIVLKDADGNIEFVVMHNGTIFNYKALAKKYIPNIDITGLTDSQVMARIFYHCGYDCLDEYYGGAVFVIIDYRKGQKIYLFKGASKTNSYAVAESEERPFYYVQTEDSFIFSSLHSFLGAATPESTVYVLPTNQLIKVKEDDIYVIKEYSRKNVAQTLPSNYNKEYWESVYGYNELDYSDWDNSNKTKYIQEPKKEVKENKKESYKTMKVTSEGIYYIDDITAHGMYYINVNGTIFKTQEEGTYKVWFWDGVLLWGQPEFIYLVNACKYFNMSFQDVKWCCPEILNYLSPYPTKDPDYKSSNNDDWYKCTDVDNLVPYSGNIKLLLDSKVYYCSEGKISHSIWNSKTKNLSDFITESKNHISNMAKLYKLLYNNHDYASDNKRDN